jgi:hypothetical protein
MFILLREKQKSGRADGLGLNLSTFVAPLYRPSTQADIARRSLERSLRRPMRHATNSINISRMFR